MASTDDIVGVIATLNRYAFMVDSQRWELMDKVFTEDVIADFGGGAVWNDLASLKRDFITVHEPFLATQHTTTNHVVTVDGDVAHSVCYVASLFVREVEPGDGGDFYEGRGWYDDKLLRTADGWRIQHRISRGFWNRGNHRVMNTMEGVTHSEPRPERFTTRKSADKGELMFWNALKKKI